MSVMRGDVFEKVGVNISTVSGEFLKTTGRKLKGPKDHQNIGPPVLVWLAYDVSENTSISLQHKIFSYSR